MLIVYGILCIAALALVGACFAVDRKKDIYLFLMSVSIFVCELGFFLIAGARTLAFALNANRIAYLGQVFLPMLLLMMILNLSRMEYPGWLPYCLLLLGLAVFAVVASPGFFPWYYRTVDIKTYAGVTQIVREYGPLHKFYYFYLLGYLVADTYVVVCAIMKKKMRSKQQIFLLLAAVYSHVVIWLCEQFLPRGFEYLSVSYVMTEIFILLVYSMVQEYSLLGQDTASLITPAEAEKLQRERQGAVETLREEQEKERIVIAFTPENIERLLTACEELSSFTERETEVLKELLADKKRRDIADELCLSESSIKKYTSSIFRKLNVESRRELFAALAKYL